jgi:hypothetical protein
MHARYSPRVRRALRRGPRPEVFRQPAKTPGGGTAAEPEPARTLAEWHDMTPGEQTAAWARLRAWVAWLYDRYELSVEDRLPRCWVSHPGLVEELYALMAWREEIYSSAQPSGQAARYWHAEMRQVLHAATTMYAAGCRTGHRGATALAAFDPALRRRWADACPLEGIPGVDVAAGRAKGTVGWASTQAIAAALDAGQAAPVPGAGECVCWGGTWWAPAASGWVQVPGPGPAWNGHGEGVTGNDSTSEEAESWQC